MSDPPGRETRTAHNRRRWSWYGHGTGVTVEKDGLGLFLDDLVYVFADVSVHSLPILWYLMVVVDLQSIGTKGSALVAWSTMVVGGALIRGGWVTPLGTGVPGWVSLTPSLVLLRGLYYNTAIGIAAFAGGTLAATTSLAVAMSLSLLVGGIAVGAFPRLAETYFRYVAGRRT